MNLASTSVAPAPTAIMFRVASCKPTLSHHLFRGCNWEGRQTTEEMWGRLCRNAWKISSSGGEGEILLQPFLLSSCDPYTSVIIRCVWTAYKRIRSQATVSIVSLIR